MTEIESLKETVSSLEAQLVALYTEKESAGSDETLRASLKSLEEQLCALYEEKNLKSGQNKSAEGVSRSEEFRVRGNAA